MIIDFNVLDTYFLTAITDKEFRPNDHILYQWYNRRTQDDGTYFCKLWVGCTDHRKVSVSKGLRGIYEKIRDIRKM